MYESITKRQLEEHINLSNIHCVPNTLSLNEKKSRLILNLGRNCADFRRYFAISSARESSPRRNKSDGHFANPFRKLATLRARRRRHMNFDDNGDNNLIAHVHIIS